MVVIFFVIFLFLYFFLITYVKILSKTTLQLPLCLTRLFDHRRVDKEEQGMNVGISEIKIWFSRDDN